MNSKEVYETCGVIADALPDADRKVFAFLVERATLYLPPQRGHFWAVQRALPGTVQPLLLPLSQELRTRKPSVHSAARRWLRDAGWVR